MEQVIILDNILDSQHPRQISMSQRILLKDCLFETPIIATVKAYTVRKKRQGKMGDQAGKVG